MTEVSNDVRPGSLIDVDGGLLLLGVISARWVRKGALALRSRRRTYHYALNLAMRHYGI